MSMAMLIIGLVVCGVSFLSFLFNRRKPIACVLALILLFSGIALVALGYWAGVETQDQLTEIRTPRRMEPETKRMLAARLKPYAGQKFDMKVFRDQDSLELATAIQAIMEEAGWVYTNVYPRDATRYAETRDHGVLLISGLAETRRTSEARTALHGALNEAGLYDDSPAFTPVNCGKSTGPIQEGTKITPIPCSESPIKSIKIHFTSHDEVIPEDTLVLLVGKERL